MIAYLEPILGGPTKLHFVDPRGRPVSTPATDAAPALNNGYLAWSSNGKLLAAMAVPGFAESTLWIIDPAAPVSGRKLLRLPGERGRGLAWARDGTALLVGVYRSTSDVVLFTRER